MLKKLFHLLAGRRYHRLILLAGLLTAGQGLWGLGQSAVYVHEAVCLPAVVADVRQKPVESPLQALRAGNYKAEVAYTPLVNFTLPNGITCNSRPLPDADADDYTIGAQVEILTMPQDPTTARLNAWKFIWGEPCVLFALGVLLVLLGRLLRGGRKKSRPAAPRREPRREVPAEPEPEPAPRRPAKKGQMELDLGPEVPPAKPKRKRKAAADSAPKTPRKRKKKEA